MIELISLPTVKWFQVLLFFIISSRLRLATTWSVSQSILSILYVLCRGFVGYWALDCLVLIDDFVVEGILSILPGISLFTLVFIFIIAVWLMRSCDFCFSCSGLMGDKFFSLSVTLLGGQIGDLCNGCFDGDFALLWIVRVGVIDPTCVFVWTTTLDPSPFATCCWAGAW